MIGKKELEARLGELGIPEAEAWGKSEHLEEFIHVRILIRKKVKKQSLESTRKNKNSNNLRIDYSIVAKEMMLSTKKQWN